MKTLKTLMALMALTALTTLTACDVATDSAGARDRSDVYRAAMTDYNAGRLDAAIDGFESAVRQDPANASARFQLACVLQDYRHDYLGAVCNFREYLKLRPDSDKSSVATERLALSERLFTAECAKKLNLSGEGAIKENARLTAENEKLVAERDDLKARLARAEARVSRLASDNESLRKLLTDKVGEEESTAAPVVPTDDELLDDGEDAVDTRAGVTDDVKALLEEEREERPESIVAPFKPSEKKVEAKKTVSEPSHEERPETYVVQEGDTLYQLAIRFYGRRSAWKLIRDANKATISTDGRIRSGQKITLPNP